jgi:hypothetical protein
LSGSSEAERGGSVRLGATKVFWSDKVLPGLIHLFMWIKPHIKTAMRVIDWYCILMGLYVQLIVRGG